LLKEMLQQSWGRNREKFKSLVTAIFADQKRLSSTAHFSQAQVFPHSCPGSDHFHIEDE